MTKAPSIVREGDGRPPEVSVIIPSYNSAGTIERCLESLIQQDTAHYFEVIVVDSGTDDTSLRVRRLLPQARIVRLAGKTLPASARNEGALRARADILAFIDSDIYTDSQWINNVVRASSSHYHLICGSIGNANPDHRVSRAEQILMFNEFLPEIPERDSWFALSGNMVMRRDSYEKFGPFIEVTAAEDIVFSRRLISNGGKILFFPGMKVLHENRTSIRQFLAKQRFLGKYTMRARRLVGFADIQNYQVFVSLFVILFPVSPVVKLARIINRNRRIHQQILKELPVLLLGLSAYCLGMAEAAFIRQPDISTYERRGKYSLIGQS